MVKRLVLATAVAVTVFLAGCGGGDSSPPPDGSVTATSGTSNGATASAMSPAPTEPPTGTPPTSGNGPTQRPPSSETSGSLTIDEVNALVTAQAPSDLGEWTPFACTVDHGDLGTGSVLTCRPDPEPTEGQFPLLTVLVLDGGTSTIAWAQAGVENPTLNADGLVSGSGALPRGLNCTDLVAHPSFVADIAGRLDPTLTYFAAVLYWFLEDRPTPRMDIDSNGIPCETLFPADVVQRVWGGGYLT